MVQNADLLGLGVSGATRDPGGSLDQVRGERLLDLELVGAILEDGDFNRHDEAHLGSRLLVEFLEELHHVDTGLTKRGTNGRSRRALAGGDVQFDVVRYLLRHRKVLGIRLNARSGKLRGHEKT